MPNGKNLKLICVSDKNYYALKALGQTADSFNDVLDKVLAPYKENGVMMKEI